MGSTIPATAQASNTKTHHQLLLAGSIPEDSNLGFVSDYSSPDIVCHIGATPGGAYVTVAAGTSVELQWTGQC